MQKQVLKPINVLHVFNKMFLNTLNNPIFNYISENKNKLPKTCKKYHFSVHDTGIVYFNFIDEKFNKYEIEIYVPETELLKTEEKFHYKTVFDLIKPLFFHKSMKIEQFYSSKDEYEINYFQKETQSCSYYIDITDDIFFEDEKMKIYKTYCTLVLLSEYEIQQLLGMVDNLSFPPPTAMGS